MAEWPVHRHRSRRDRLQRLRRSKVGTQTTFRRNSEPEISRCSRFYATYKYLLRLGFEDIVYSYLTMPAIVTTKPRLRRITTPILWRSRIFNIRTMGMGRVVMSRSRKQLIMPQASVNLPSFMHLPEAGNIQ